MGFADANLMETGRSLLVVVDVQEPFLKVLFEAERVVANTRKLVAAARICRVPILATTQNAARLGPLEASITELMPDARVIDKMAFSCMGSEEFRQALAAQRDRTQIVLCGLETHICICQTGHDLLNDGYVVHLAADAISSRTEMNFKYGLERLRHVGATVSCTEGVIYEWLRVAGTPEFKEVLPWVK